MPSEVLTDEKCRRARPIDGKVTEYADQKRRGLALRVSPGSAKNPEGAKSWTVRYRTGAGEQRRVSLGSYPAVTLSKARDKALAVLAGVADGRDPGAERKAARIKAQSARLDTVTSIGEHYLAEAAKGRHRANGRPKREGTLKLERYYFERHVQPEFGKRAIGSLTRAEIQTFINKMSDENAPSTGRQCRVVLQRLFAYAQWQEVTDSNPCQHVHAPTHGQRDRVLTEAELRTIWLATALPLSGKFQMSPGIAVAIRVMLVTLQRRSEVLGMHTREIDRDARVWIIPGARTKNHREHIVPLSDLALSLVDDALSAAGVKAGFLFPSPRDAKRPVTPGSATLAFARMCSEIKVSDARPHDLRRTGATTLTSERIGISRFLVSRVLNQISDTGGAAPVTGIYDRNEYLPQKRTALDAWADMVNHIAPGQGRGGNVVPIAKAE